MLLKELGSEQSMPLPLQESRILGVRMWTLICTPGKSHYNYKINSILFHTMCFQMSLQIAIYFINFNSKLILVCYAFMRILRGWLSSFLHWPVPLHMSPQRTWGRADKITLVHWRWPIQIGQFFLSFYQHPNISDRFPSHFIFVGDKMNISQSTQ